MNIAKERKEFLEARDLFLSSLRQQRDAWIHKRQYLIHLESWDL